MLERGAALKSPPLLPQPGLHPQSVSYRHHGSHHYSLSCSFARTLRTPWQNPATRPLLPPSYSPLGWARSSHTGESTAMQAADRLRRPPTATQTDDRLCRPLTTYRVPRYDVGTLAQEGAEEQRPPRRIWSVDGDRQGPSAVACGSTRRRHAHLQRHTHPHIVMKPCFFSACLLTQHVHEDSDEHILHPPPS